MAEKIGYVSFSAFDFQKANEFEASKRNAYSTANPTRSWFDRHPPIPHWKVMSQFGNEPIPRPTPDEFIPLMNEYHRYFHENAVKNEAYLRWVRRHRAWDRETEIHFKRFTHLRDYLNDKFAADDYARRGRLHQTYDRAMQKAWMSSELLQRSSENEAIEQKIRSAKSLQKKLETEALFRDRAFNLPDERQAWKHQDEHTRVNKATNEERKPIQVNIENSWSQGLAIARYHQQLQQLPVAPVNLNTSTGTGINTNMSPPIVKKVSGLG